MVQGLDILYMKLEIDAACVDCPVNEGVEDKSIIWAWGKTETYHDLNFIIKGGVVSTNNKFPPKYT
jgi:hypothetical protein